MKVTMVDIVRYLNFCRIYYILILAECTGAKKSVRRREDGEIEARDGGILQRD